MSTVAGYGCWRSPITPSWSPRPRSGWRSRPSTATSPTGSRPGRRKTVAPCWCGGAPGGAPAGPHAGALQRADAGARVRRRRLCGRGTASSSRSTSPTSGSGACTGGRTTPLTPESGARLRYADLELDPAGNRLFAVREDHRGGGEAGQQHRRDRPRPRDDAGSELAAGHDFFSSPRLSPDRRRLAWLSWDHPDMPWDSDRAVAGGDRGGRADRSGAPGRRRGRGGDRPAGLVARRASSTSCRTEPAGGTSIGCGPTDRFPSARCPPNSPDRPGPSAGGGTASSAPTSSWPASREDGRWHLATIAVATGALSRARSALHRMERRQRRQRPRGAARGRARPAGGDRPARARERNGERAARAGDLPVDPAYLAAPRRSSSRASRAGAPTPSTIRRPTPTTRRPPASGRR